MSKSNVIRDTEHYMVWRVKLKRDKLSLIRFKSPKSMEICLKTDSFKEIKILNKIDELWGRHQKYYIIIDKLLISFSYFHRGIIDGIMRKNLHEDVIFKTYLKIGLIGRKINIYEDKNNKKLTLSPKDTNHLGKIRIHHARGVPDSRLIKIMLNKFNREDNVKKVKEWISTT